MSESVLLEFQRIDGKQAYELALLTLNRPEKSNALNKDMIQNLSKHLRSIRENSSCRALVIRARGKNFCAGADLAWMKESAGLSPSENLQDIEALAEVFQQIYSLDIPVLAVVQGLAFGGALGLVACADIAIAHEDASFSLREVKVGLMPAIILPYLHTRITPMALRYLAFTGSDCSAQDAKHIGLITKVYGSEDATPVIRSCLNALFEGSPRA